MGKNGSVNVRDLEEFKKKIEKTLGASQIDEFIESCAKELAARLLAKVIKRTPVGQYPASSGKKGGTLRRGWTGEKSQSALLCERCARILHSWRKGGESLFRRVAVEIR